MNSSVYIKFTKIYIFPSFVGDMSEKKNYSIVCSNKVFVYSEIIENTKNKEVKTFRYKIYVVGQKYSNVVFGMYGFNDEKLFTWLFNLLHAKLNQWQGTCQNDVEFVDIDEFISTAQTCYLKADVETK